MTDEEDMAQKFESAEKQFRGSQEPKGRTKGILSKMQGDYVNSLSGKSSLFRLHVKPGSRVFRYDVSMEKVFPEGVNRRGQIMTKQSDAHFRNFDALICRKIIELVHKETNGFGSGRLDHNYVYDGKGALYSLHDLGEGGKGFFEAEKVNETHPEIRMKPGVRVTFAITPNVACPVFDYSDFKETQMKEEDTEMPDQSVRTFLELVTSEFLIASGGYQHSQGGALFKSQPAMQRGRGTPGIQMFEGLKKGVRIVDENTAWLILDMSRSNFYASRTPRGDFLTLSDTFGQFVRSEKDLEGKRRFETYFKDVRLMLKQDVSRVIKFYRLSDEPVNSPKFNVDGVSLAGYYRTKYGIELKYGHLPGVYSSEIDVDRKSVYPLEVLRVLPGQAIAQEKMSSEFESAIHPSDRYAYIMKQVELLCSGPGAEFLEKFGVRVEAGSNNVTIHCRALPVIRTSSGKITPQQDGSFLRDMRRAQFLHTPNCLKNWIVCHDETLNEMEIKNFIRQLLSSVVRHGLGLVEPQAICRVVLSRLEEVFMHCKSSDVHFILYIDDKATNSHGLLKLLEAKHKILTQHVTIQTVGITQQSMIGVAMKLNSKCFGLNFLPVFGDYMADLDLEKNPDLLVIGYDVAYPSAGYSKEFAALKEKGMKDLTSSDPAVVGIGANKNEHLSIFSADFFYQEATYESLTSNHRLQKAVKDVVVCARRTGCVTGLDRKPTRLVILRNGVGEGQYKMVLEQELKAILAGYADGMQSIGAKDLADKCPKVTFLVATKRHNKRFFRVDGQGKIFNTRPGDVINEGVVRSDVINETFFQTHNAVKGTAHLTQYTVLLNEMGIPMLKLQEFMLMLAFMHQVSACPTSLPLPVYLASETAKRGQQVYNEWKKTQGAGVGDHGAGSLSQHFDELTALFGYSGSTLEGTRYNS